MMNVSYNSLSRSHTPNTLSSANRPSPSPKCFGKNTHVLKEEYEREKSRWQQKLDEAEQKLNEASINNSELFQIKAELNRKIIDFEKNQRPLIEQNRRLNERIRLLSGDTKALEQKLCYSQDDFLSLRDAYDRLVKENSTLKEQRAFPEKLEELGRYRGQVLEYSKCITACRQSILEKDRRYDLLVQKFKKYRKTLLTKRNGLDEDDRQSCVGSEGSESNSIGLDTIAEDLDEDVELTAELLHPPMTPILTPIEYSLKQQLDLANMTIIELQNTIEFGDLENSNRLTTSVDKLRDEVKTLKEAKTKLEKELANTQEHNDLLEFQLVELTEGSQRRVGRLDTSCSRDVKCSTELELVIEEVDLLEFDIKSRTSITPDFIAQTRELLHAFLLCNRANLVERKHRDGIRSGMEVIDGLQNQLAFSETELNMANCEMNRQKRQFEEELSELKQKNEEFLTKKQQKKKELQAEIDQLKKEKKEESKRVSKQIQELNTQLSENAKEIAEKTEQIRQLNGEIRTNRAEVESLRSKATSDEQMLNTLKQNLQKAEDKLVKSQNETELLTQQNEGIERRLAEERSQFEEITNCLKGDLETKDQQAQAATNQLLIRLAEMEKSKDAAEEKMMITKTKLDDSRMEFKKIEEELRKTLEESERQKEAMLAEKQKLEKELSDANALVKSLRDQIRPIGSQLERRYEESRYRLSEALKKINDLEDAVNKSNEKTRQLEMCADTETYMQKMQQLQAYNHELEQQFNAQMDMITALKKKFIVMKGNNQSTDSIGWTSNSSEGTNSMDDEQYHSEGSDVGRSLKAE